MIEWYDSLCPTQQVFVKLLFIAVIIFIAATQRGDSKSDDVRGG